MTRAKRSQSQLLELKTKELELRKAQVKIREMLPHLYGHKLYTWQRKFIDSTNRINLLTAANQIGKSSAGQRRCIMNATDPIRWELMWGKGVKPRMFWYFYPDQDTLEKEFETKWVPEWLPRGEMELDPQYGWKVSRDKGVPKALAFNAGPIVYFMYYSKKVTNVQAGSVHEIYADEELPLNFWDELSMRMFATNGIFNSTFTPTLNQLFWKQAMEGKKVLPHAFKQTVSMYDCLTYEDGTPSTAVTLEKIEAQKQKCKNETEVQRRIFGKFVTEEGRTYFAFDYDRHMKKRYDITGWHVYAALDYGSGGGVNHPAAIVFIAVRPDHQKGAVFKAWRGDNEQTTAGDVFEKYMRMKAEIPVPVTLACYDHANKDLGLIAERNNVTLLKADKTRETGEDILNTLFKYDMLDIFDDDGELEKLGGELSHIMKNNQSGNNKDGDDLADATRYGNMLIPWDFEPVMEAFMRAQEKPAIKPRPKTEKELLADQIRERRGETVHGNTEETEGWGELEEEFDYWQDQYG